MTDWRVLKVKTGSEVAVAQSLDVPAYLPRRAERYFNRRQRKVKVRRVVAFPGYLFVRAETPQHLRRHKDAFGWLRTNDRSIATLNKREFDQLIELEKEMLTLGFLPVPRSAKRLHLGDVVEINEGHVLEGFRGVVKKITGGRLKLDLSDRHFDVEVGMEHVAAA